MSSFVTAGPVTLIQCLGRLGVPPGDLGTLTCLRDPFWWVLISLRKLTLLGRAGSVITKLGREVGGGGGGGGGVLGGGGGGGGMAMGWVWVSGAKSISSES